VRGERRVQGLGEARVGARIHEALMTSVLACTPARTRGAQRGRQLRISVCCRAPRMRVLLRSLRGPLNFFYLSRQGHIIFGRLICPPLNAVMLINKQITNHKLMGRARQQRQGRLDQDCVSGNREHWRPRHLKGGNVSVHWYQTSKTSKL
jgi:hypothetical protein